MKRFAIIASLAILAAAPAAPQENGCGEDAMIVFDGSGSMAEMGFNDISEPRIFDARRAMAEVIPEIAAKRRLGLVIYGPGAEACSGVELRFTPMENAAPRILSEVNALQPAGDTPLTEAVKAAADALIDESGGGAVVLVTDGKETCSGAPCQLAAALADQNITLHVIGFKVRGAHFSWGGAGSNDYSDTEAPSRCLADRTGGVYVRAETLEQLKAALRTTLGCRIMM